MLKGGHQPGAQRKGSSLPKGRISIETGQNNGWAVLAIKDTGCGMSADFLKRSLVGLDDHFALEHADRSRFSWWSGRAGRGSASEVRVMPQTGALMARTAQPCFGRFQWNAALGELFL